MLFQRCFVNVATTSINVRRLSFHFQPNINVEITLMNVDYQRCFNGDSALMCLLGTSVSEFWRVKDRQSPIVDALFTTFSDFIFD